MGEQKVTAGRNAYPARVDPPESNAVSLPHVTAGDTVSSPVITVTADSAADDIRDLLIDRRIRRVPVVRAGCLVGIVSRHDLVAGLATERACQVCGEPVRGEHPPDTCPKCYARSSQFELPEQPPGA